MSDWFHAHVHSQYSVLDGMPSVKSLVERATSLGQPALALTDHGVMSGCIQLYKSCVANGILPFPGVEAYVVSDVGDKKARRHHLTLLARNRSGYRTLVKLVSRSHERDRYYYKPRIDFGDIAELATSGKTDGLIALSGCFYGHVMQALSAGDVDGAKQHLLALRSWFPHLFLEVQHHNINHNGITDDELLVEAMQLANDAGVVAHITQDTHYLRESDKEAHTMMKTLISSSPDDTDIGFPGDSYHLASESWVRKHYRGSKAGQEAWRQSLDASTSMINLHELTLPALDTYNYVVPKTKNANGGKPGSAIDSLTKIGMNSGRWNKRKAYIDRFTEELAVISKLSMADYFILVLDYVSWAKSKDIMVAARGSANASLVCYYLGITDVDPITWKLPFERFLSRDRIKPPDIDLDVEDQRRDEIIEYIKTRYNVCRIGTFMSMGVDSEGRGSIFVSYLSARKRQLGAEAFNKQYGAVKTVSDLETFEPEQAERLMALSRIRPFKSAGTHAAGIVVCSTQRPLNHYIPTMLIASSGSIVTQMTMDDVEEAGYVKIDMLGLRSLTTLRKALELSGMSVENIPLNDRKTMAMLRQGRTDTGVFQFEGYTQARGCRELGVKNLADMVLVNALFRPATISSGTSDEYIYRRNGKKYDNSNAVLEKHTRDTHGLLVYQEQVISVLRDIGLSIEQLNVMLKAIKASNSRVISATAEFQKLRATFERKCLSSSMTAENIDSLWAAIEGFSEYGFNRSHATAYALLGYRLAYLRVHYPIKFMSALLESTSGTPKELPYVREARRMGIRILSADVNLSGPYWTYDSKKVAIRKGLSSIKGVGVLAANEISDNAPYRDVQDLIDRTSGRAVTGGRDYARHGTLTGTMRILAESNALRSIGGKSYD